MAEVDIGGEFYWSYADLETANAYMNAVIGPFGDAWREASEEDQARGLVTGTRFIDGAKWKGAKTDEAQPGAFPRTGLKYPGGEPVPSDEIPGVVVQASIELAAYFLEGSGTQNAAAVASGTKRLKAGSVEIEYFLGGINGRPSLYPPFFLSLLGEWLLGTGSGQGGSKSFGTCGKTAFRRGFKPAQAY